MLNVDDDPIYNMLFEKKRASAGDDEPKIRNKIVSSFPGRPRDDLKLADPKAVFRKLGISAGFRGDTVLDSISKLLKAAKRNEVIGKAYGTLTMVQEEGKEDRKGLLVKLGELDAKNATQYMRILLIDAFAVRALREDDDLRVQNVERSVLIYPSKRGRGTWVGKIVPV